MKAKQFVLAALSLVVIAACSWFLWRNYFAPPKINAALHQAIGEVLAAEVIKVSGGKGELTVITMAPGDSEVMAAQFAAFKAALGKAGGLKIRKHVEIESDKKAKYGPGYGLSASKLARELKKHPDVAVLVSFVGVPTMDESELKELGEPVPPIVAFARDADKLGALAQKQILRAAIVPRFRFPAPGPEVPHTPMDWFNQKYQVLTLTAPPP